MKVFISWSGETSRNIAEALHQWLPNVIQAVKPYYSPDDISKGSRWSSEIAQELEEARVGVICLTRDNWQNTWINFEAGALSKNIDKSKVVPLLFDLEPTEITGPLVQFQAAKFSKAEMLKVARMINTELESNALGSDVLSKVFEMWWPELNSKIQEQLNFSTHPSGKFKRDQRDMLDEILTILRNISNQTLSPIHGDFINSKLLAHISETWTLLTRAYINDDKAQLYQGLIELNRILNFLLDNSNTVRSTKDKFLSSVDESLNQLKKFYDITIAPLRPNSETAKPGALEALRRKIRSEGNS